MVTRDAVNRQDWVADARRRRLPLGLFDRYLLRGVAPPFLVLLFAVTVALLLERALRLIHELAGLGADLGYFFPLLLQLVPYYVESAIPLAFMIALVLMVARLDERLELDAMLASGVSLARIAAPLVAFGCALAAVALLVGGWLEPIGRYGHRSLRTEAVSAGRLGALQPLAVYQFSENLAITFDQRSADGGARGIFVWQLSEDDGEVVISGARGRLGFAPRTGVIGIDFADGRYVAQRPQGPYLLDFDDLTLRQSMQLPGASWKRGADPKELTFSELLNEKLGGAKVHPPHLVDVELYGRLARALLIPLVPLIVLPLAFATKKGGRVLGVLVCGAFVALSRHLLGAAKNVVEAGTVSAPLGLLGTLAVLSAIALLLFASARSLPSHSPLHSLLNPVSRALVRIAPGRSGMPGSSGRGLAGYLVLEMCKWVLLALAIFALFLLAIDLVERGPQFLERGFGSAEIARYAMLRLSAILQQAIPMAALAGALAAFAVLASRNEVTAIRAAGLSQWRILAKFAPAALLLAAGSAALAEWGTPATQSRLAAWWAATDRADNGAMQQGRWFRIADKIVQADGASEDGRSIDGVDIYLRDPKGRLVERIDADRAVLDRRGWILHDVQRTRYGNGQPAALRVDRLEWDVALQPDDVQAFFSQASALSAASAQRALDHAAPLDRSELLFATRLHRSLAEPIAPFVMLLFALPLAFVAPRTGKPWPALVYAGGAGLLYLVGDGILTVSAQVGYVSPMFGAWAAPVVALLFGLAVLAHTER